MKLLVLGGTGMAGHVVATYFQEHGYDVETIASSHRLNQTTRLIDATDKSELLSGLGNKDYDVVVNCIGLLVQKSEEEKEKASYLNAYLPRLLEKYYQNTQTKVIHISSDGVFSGAQPEYKENSPYDGQSFYSRSKALGEINNAKDLTIRTSIVGPELSLNGRSLFGWFFRQTEEIQGYTNSFWKGITTVELAKAIEAMIEQNISGIYHLVPSAKISKFDLLSLFKEVLKRHNLQIMPSSATGNNALLLNTRQDFTYTLPGYQDMVNDMLAWIQSHEELYPHYCS